jgi:thiamine biosynthesis lipoprotein
MRHLYFIEFRAMGCLVNAQIETEADGNTILRQLPFEVEAIEARLSRFRLDSELMQLNRRAGEWIGVGEILFENVQAAKHAARLTDGLFNPLVLPAMLANGYDRSFEQINMPHTAENIPAADWRGIELRLPTREIRIPVNSALDLGGIAKGWTAARLADGLAKTGSCLVNMGGDMAVRGAPDGLPGWQIEISDPFTDTFLGSLYLTNTTIVTSGVDFRRWSVQEERTQRHIVNPQTGRSVESDVLSATVVHPHAPTAEAYAKAIMLRGAEAGLNWLSQQWHAAGLVVQHDGMVLTTSNFAQLLNERLLS